MRILIVCTLVAAPALASAQMVYKCVPKKGPPVYQSEPCPADSAQPKAWAATPEAAPTNEERWRRYHRERKGAADSAYLRTLAGQGQGGGNAAAIGPSPVANACAAMKAARDQRDQAAKGNLSLDERRMWQDRVYAACKF